MFRKNLPFIVVIMCLVCVALLLGGCATKHYGRLAPLTVYEKSNFSCREIDIEIAKVQGFIDQVENESRFNEKSVLSFLGDFGIGNVMEKDAALDSARARLKDLQDLKVARRCVVRINR